MQTGHSSSLYPCVRFLMMKSRATRSKGRGTSSCGGARYACNTAMHTYAPKNIVCMLARFRICHSMVLCSWQMMCKSHPILFYFPPTFLITLTLEDVCPKLEDVCPKLIIRLAQPLVIQVLRRVKGIQVNPMDTANKIVVFGGGSFGTAMGVSLARQKAKLDVVLLLRDADLVTDINTAHVNTRYLKVGPVQL